MKNKGHIYLFHCAVQGSGQGLFPLRWFLPLHQCSGDDLTWPLSPTNPFWSGESAAAPAAGSSWPRLAPPSLERSWRPLTLDSAGWNVIYLISCQLRWDESLMVSAATQVSHIRKHGSHSSTQLFSLSLVEASCGFRATFQWLNYVQLAQWE